MANKQSDPMAMAAMMNGGMGNQWMNNPFAYIMFLALFGGAGFGGFGNRGNLVQDAEIQNQIASLRSQMADNHNADLLMSAVKGNDDALKTLGANLNCDFNQLQQAIAQEAKNHEDLEKINSLLEDWNPALAEKRKQDERINTIEQEVRSIGQQLKDFFSEFKNKTP